MEDFNEIKAEEYENFDISEFTSNKTTNQNVQIKIKSIEFEGLKGTNEEFLMNTIKGLAVDKAENLLELSDTLNLAFNHLERLNIFKDVSVVIDQATIIDGERELVDDNAIHNVKVIFKCKEKRFNIRTGTELQRKDIAWNFGGQFFNLFGRAESLEINSSIGANSSMPFNLNFTKPIIGDPDKLFILNSSKFRENFLNHCKWRQETLSLSMAIQLQNTPENRGRNGFGFGIGRHEFKYLAEFRHLFDVQSGASHVIRDQAGHSIKSSILHSWNLSIRDSAVLPTKGYLVRISNELAGLGGSEQFFKSELALQNNWTPIKFTKGLLTFTNTFRIGHSLPLNPRGKAISFPDRFQMGGPTSLRGFAVNSLGPRQFSDAIGGTSLIETGLQISFPIIKSAENFARGHLFINSGLLSDKNIYSTIMQTFKERTSKSLYNNSILSEALNPNVSIGGGFMFKMTESSRLELNFSVPILSQNGIEVNRGIQVGIGLEFL